MSEFHFGPAFNKNYLNEVKGETEAYNSRRVGIEKGSHEHKSGAIKKWDNDSKEDAKRNNTIHEPMKNAKDYKERTKHANQVKKRADSMNGHRDIQRINKKYDGPKAANEEVNDMNEFHFGPAFEPNYLEEKCSEKGSGCKSCKEEDEDIIDIEDMDECDKKLKEAAYDGSAIENDEDPTEPTLDDIVNSEEDIAANYHFGPAFAKDTFLHKESRKRYRQ